MTVEKALSLRAVKGRYGYLKSSKLFLGLRTFIFFLIAFILFFLGRSVYPKYYTVFTVAAMVACIPAAMAAVTFIMFIRFKSGSSEIYDECERIHGSIPLFYDSIITTTLKSYGINVFAAAGKNLIAFSDYDKLDIPVLEKHLKEMADKNELKGWTVKVFTDMRKFSSRLEHLSSEFEKATPEDERMIRLIGNLSL